MKSIRILLLLAVSLCFACSKSETVVNGEVFVVTKGAGNYKLGAVQVAAVKEKDLNDLLAANKETFAENMAELQDALDECGKIGENYSSSQLYPSWEEIQKRRDTCYNDAGAKETELANFLFTPDVKPVKTTVTNADGKFTLAIEGTEPVYLMAKAQREVAGSNTEHYVWVQKVTPEGKEQSLILSSNNMLGTSALEGMISAAK